MENAHLLVHYRPIHFERRWKLMHLAYSPWSSGFRFYRKHEPYPSSYPSLLENWWVQSKAMVKWLTGWWTLLMEFFYLKCPKIFLVWLHFTYKAFVFLLISWCGSTSTSLSFSYCPNTLSSYSNWPNSHDWFHLSSWTCAFASTRGLGPKVSTQLVFNIAVRSDSSSIITTRMHSIQCK